MPEARPRHFPLDRFWRVLLVIGVAALAVRVGYVAVVKNGSCYVHDEHDKVLRSPSECAVGDQIFYNTAADRLGEGRGFVEVFAEGVYPPRAGTEPAADHPPLTVIVIGGVSFLGNHPPLSWVSERTHVREHRYTMALLGSVLVLLVGLLGRAVGGDRVGWIAAGVAAVYPNLWVNDGLIMSETITGLTVVSALLLAIRLGRAPRARTAVALGAVCGIAALSRVELLLFLPLVVVPAALAARAQGGRKAVSRRDRWRLAALSVAAAGVVIAPWVVYNQVRFDEATFISTNDGITLAGSNCDPVYSGGAIGLWKLVPSCMGSAPPGDQSSVARVYRNRAFGYIKAHMSRVPLVVAARIGRTWGVFRPRQMLYYNVGEGRERWVTAAGMWFYYPLLAAALAGGVLLYRRDRRALWALVVPAIVVTLGAAATYGQTRFRAAAEPTIVVLAAAAMVAVVERRGRSARGEMPAAEAPDGPE